MEHLVHLFELWLSVAALGAVSAPGYLVRYGLLMLGGWLLWPPSFASSRNGWITYRPRFWTTLMILLTYALVPGACFAKPSWG
jgi:hypothetical protein